MNRTTITSAVVIIIFIVVLIVWFAPKKNFGNDSSATVALAVAENSFDFGQIGIQAGLVRHEFKMKNQSADPLTVEKIYTSCMCTTARWLKAGRALGPFGMPGHEPLPRINETMAPNEEAIIEVVFDPAAHGPSGIGRIERSIYIETADAQPLILNLTANVTP